jgi:hypothetical protein
MRGERFTRTALSLLLLLAALPAEELPDSRRQIAPAPSLGADEKLKIREAQVAALQSSQQLSEFVARIQAQVEAMPEYRRLKYAAQATADNYTQALQRAVAAAKCEGCELDPNTLALTRPEAAQAKPAKRPTPVLP